MGLDVIVSNMLVYSQVSNAGLMLLGCGMMTTGVPTMITAGLTGTLPGASDYRSTTAVWAQNHPNIGRVLLDDSGATAGRVLLDDSGATAASGLSLASPPDMFKFDFCSCKSVVTNPALH